MIASSAECRRARGLTLIELMATVAVIGVVSGLAGVGVQEVLQRRREAGSVRSLWAASLEARQRAVAHGQTTRLVVESITRRGRTVQVVRWERPPCSAGWGGACPAPSCETATCRTGCACNETGPEIELPAGIDATELHGLCFRGGTGIAFRASGITCAAPPSAAEEWISNVRVPYQPEPFRLVFDGLTGVGELVDCASSRRSADLCPSGSGSP